MIRVTDTAINKFKEILKQDKMEDAYIRIYISKMGWGGPQFGLALEELLENSSDIVEDVDGLKFLYEQNLSRYIDAKKIDYQTGNREGFVFTDQGPEVKCDGGCCDL